ncbi:hypothetical protein Taro_040246, partial [Colocasia esculenta]|nr:hypothetical protein [Colocasia esculenta]
LPRRAAASRSPSTEDAVRGVKQCAAAWDLRRWVLPPLVGTPLSLSGVDRTPRLPLKEVGATRTDLLGIWAVCCAQPPWRIAPGRWLGGPCGTLCRQIFLALFGSVLGRFCAVFRVSSLRPCQRVVPGLVVVFRAIWWSGPPGSAPIGPVVPVDRSTGDSRAVFPAPVEGVPRSTDPLRHTSLRPVLRHLRACPSTRCAFGLLPFPGTPILVGPLRVVSEPRVRPSSCRGAGQLVRSHCLALHGSGAVSGGQAWDRSPARLRLVVVFVHASHSDGRGDLDSWSSGKTLVGAVDY